MENLNPNSVIFIGAQECKEVIEKIGGRFEDENTLFPNLDFLKVKQLILKRDKFAIKRTGWYFQQFLKIAYAQICEEEYYLVWDADTVPLKEINMLDSENYPYFDIKTEYHKPYFTTIKKLFSGSIQKCGDFSFISEHMLIKTSFMKEMIHQIEKNKELDGKFFYEKILSAVRDIDLCGSGFSEFETYGNFVVAKYPHFYKFRKVKSLRSGDKYLGATPTRNVLEWAKESYPIITLENRDKESSKSIYDIERLMQMYSLEDIVEKTYKGE